MKFVYDGALLDTEIIGANPVAVAVEQTCSCPEDHGDAVIQPDYIQVNADGDVSVYGTFLGYLPTGE